MERSTFRGTPHTLQSGKCMWARHAAREAFAVYCAAAETGHSEEQLRIVGTLGTAERFEMSPSFMKELAVTPGHGDEHVRETNAGRSLRIQSKTRCYNTPPTLHIAISNSIEITTRATTVLESVRSVERAGREANRSGLDAGRSEGLRY